MHQEIKRASDDDRLKIAVFIDFDNIEIGVKTTLNRQFDVGSVLEAVKERGEVVTKIAYGNWKQAESYSREMTEHAVHMVQRNTTPGGDKNGADINLALDALEMAFTRDHINAFVIVGGDSDFIALVEKLKQYDKKVFIVGGRAFTSVILQKNCHEFIAYENLVGVQPGTRKAPGRGTAAGAARIERAVPLVRRALKVLSEREVSPQLGLLKSTLLQLDSTFSERDYGAGTFREFIQKLARAGFVSLKQVDRSLMVELKEVDAVTGEAPPPSADEPPSDHEGAGSSRAETAEALHRVKAAFQCAGSAARWPMYLRNIRQFLNSADPYFDEHRFSLSRIHDLVREGQRAGMFRIERSRQGGLRILPGERLAEVHPDNAAADPAAAEGPAGAPPGPFLESTLEPEPPPQPSARGRSRGAPASGRRRSPAKTARRPAATG
ncbi:MAG: NYN domain-containing protein [Acidobacteria bacterium]|nr:NYN domain-containing protein [Acidobacteriota bacterium]